MHSFSFFSGLFLAYYNILICIVAVYTKLILLSKAVTTFVEVICVFLDFRLSFFRICFLSVWPSYFFGHVSPQPHRRTRLCGCLPLTDVQVLFWYSSQIYMYIAITSWHVYKYTCIFAPPCKYTSPGTCTPSADVQVHVYTCIHSLSHWNHTPKTSNQQAMQVCLSIVKKVQVKEQSHTRVQVSTAQINPINLSITTTTLLTTTAGFLRPLTSLMSTNSRLKRGQWRPTKYAFWWCLRKTKKLTTSRGITMILKQRLILCLDPSCFFGLTNWS